MNDRPVSPSGLNDLLSPTLQEHSASIPTEKPWMIQSQFYVAFFGGVLPLTVIAYLNSKKLGLPARKRKQIILMGAIALTVAFAGAMFILNSTDAGGLGQVLHNSGIRRPVRWSLRIVAILLYFPLRHIQMPADRLYQFNTDEEEPYASLWKAGLLAVLVLGTLQSFAFLALFSLIT
jgi:hypothetical protein